MKFPIQIFSKGPNKDEGCSVQKRRLCVAEDELGEGHTEQINLS